jgi:hypothetical protein
MAFLAARANAENLLTNPRFDTNLSGWGFTPPPAESAKMWSPLDADGATNSGSGVVINSSSSAGSGLAALSQCVTGIVAGQTYELAGEVLLPAGQGRTADALLSGYWHSGPSCSPFPPIATFGAVLTASGEWTTAATSVEAPPGTHSAWILLFVRKNEAGGGFKGHFDNLSFCREGQCAAPGDGWLTSSEFPDFRFRVQFSTAEGPFYGAKESDCLPDTLCVSSELRGRTAVLLRIIGPRPNGHLWFQATRFPAQQVDIEVQQLSTGIVKTYRLDRLDPDDTEIPGRLDRTAFMP